jgi:outer membrane protein assembly factor BamB
MATQSQQQISKLAVALVVLSSVGIGIARATADQFDFAVANVLTFILGVVLVESILSLVLRYRGWSFKSRMMALMIPFALLALGGILFKPVGVDSELIPRLKFRWQADRPLEDQVDQQSVAKGNDSASEEASAVGMQRREKSDNDYPGFLGADRRATLENVRLDSPEQWTANPPKVLWKQPIGQGWSAFSASGDYAVTMEQHGEEESLRAYDLSSGKLLWKNAWASRHATGLGGVGPRSTPTIADGVVFAHGANGRLVAVSLSDGKEIWNVDLLELAGVELSTAEQDVAWGRSGSPLLVGDKLIAPLGGSQKGKISSLVCLNAKTGTEIWRGGTSQIGYSSPALLTLGGIEQIVSVNETTVSSHHPENGTILWETEWLGQSNGAANVSQPVQVDSEHVLLSKAYGTGAKLIQVKQDQSGKWSVKEVWSNNAVLKTKYTNVVIHQGYAFGLSDGILECVDLKDGKRQWKAKRYRQGQLMRIGSHLLIISEDGYVAIANTSPEKFEELCTFPAITGITWNNPALAGDLLLVRNDEQAACLRLPLKKESSPAAESVSSNQE